MPNTGSFKVTFVIFEETKSNRYKVQKSTRTFIGNIELRLKDLIFFKLGKYQSALTTRSSDVDEWPVRNLRIFVLTY